MAGNVPCFYCALVGDRGTGKTSFTLRHQTGEFVKKYRPSLVYSNCLLEFHTTKGDIQFSVWNTVQLNDLYFLNVQCAIIMAEANASKSFIRVPSYQSELRAHFGDIPIALCGNKMDLGTRASKSYQLYLANADTFEYFDISVKKTLNCELPFLWLSRQLLGNAELQFVAKPARFPPDLPKRHWEKIFLENEFINQVPPIADDEW